MKHFLLVAFVSALAFSASAQCDEWKWPEDKKTAEEKNVLYNDALRNDDFEKAKGPHQWLLQNAPDLHSAIYINGEKIYKGLVEAADDAGNDDAKQNYVDSLMLIYDMRAQYCNNEADVVLKKAYSAYRYNIKQKSQMPVILELFDKAYELNGNNMDYYMILPYMSTVQYNAKYVKNLSDTQILDYYERIQGIIDYQIENKSKQSIVDKLKDYKGTVDGILVGLVNIDCDFVRTNLGPKFQENPNDLKLAKKIFGFMLNGKCTDDPLWLQAGETIMANEPDFGIAKSLGAKFKAADEDEKATKYFNQALTLTEDPDKKADIYIQLGSMKSGSAARELYRKALQVDPSKSEAYSAIGYLYYSSFDQCAGKEDMIKDRAVFLAAYDMFQRAGNTKMMNSAKEQFPSKEEIFTFNYTAGDEVSVGCWIGVTTTIRSRD
ncbi:hypothetical protein E1176_14095 [Fulvivirga sp. RKSG066]|uniref:hypothetical protein n=1 Tax=Fulvivirga aurantia TaxID=2529383 RepID=UPI0012BB796A|nr:hypothetical protein [Fulvivirga aurantia]MTI22158.1 hypothetical protein [Fulvivirga aurantia]